jgi:hypothetical protein
VENKVAVPKGERQQKVLKVVVSFSHSLDACKRIKFNS